MKTETNILKPLFFILILISCLGSTIVLSGETDNTSLLNHKKWEELSKGMDYTENYKEFEKKEDPLQKNKKDNPINLSVLKPVFIIIIIGMLAYLLFMILKRVFNFFDERVKNTELKAVVENLEENIHNADFDSLLKQALSNNEFKLAVRILYLNVIKQLSDKQLIKWKKEKTNGHYVREMGTNKLGSPFAYLTLVYEQAWFSHHHVDKDKYQLISEHFYTFINRLN